MIAAQRRRRRVAAAILVAALLVANGLLAYLVWDRMADMRVATTPAPAVTTDAPDVRPAPSQITGRSELTVGPGVFVVSSRGACMRGAQPTLHRSSDGETYTEVTLPTSDPSSGDAAGPPEPLRTVDHVSADSADEIIVFGADHTCRTRAYATADGGRTWAESDPAGIWFLTPSEMDLVAPDGRAVTPGCTVRELHPRDALNVRVACADDRILGTSDGGESWVVLGMLQGLRSIVFSGLGSGLGVAPDEDCGARAHRTGNAGDTWVAAGCITESEDPVALAGTPERAYALVGTQHIVVSTDAGQTWQNLADE